MVILTKKRFGFVKQDGTERIDAERFLTKGGMEIEDAPDWIATDPLYALAVESGDLVPVNGKTPKAEAEAVATATAVPAPTKAEAKGKK